INHGVAILLIACAFRDNDSPVRHLEVGVELGARRALDAVRRPGTALRDEVNRLARVPVSGDKDSHAYCGSLLQVLVADRHHSVPLHNRQRATATEVVLHIYNDQGVRHCRPPLFSLRSPWRDPLWRRPPLGAAWRLYGKSTAGEGAAP